tara:strand:- start:1006 stop:1710 length:705 start_codon:yes stop_codon:yes gene_type:complete
METITICTPVYKRHEFLKLWINNIKSQTYDHKLITVQIDECKSDEPFITDLKEVQDYLAPMTVVHNVYNSRSGIGEKRNRLVKNSKTKYIAFFDSDDYYFPYCLEYNYGLLKDKKVKCVGSDKMLFCYVEDDFLLSGINCGDKIHLIHEASLFFEKKWFNTTNKFQRKNCGEGKRLFEGISPKQVAISDIKNVMICICWEGNTVNKDQFKDTQRKQILDDSLKNALIQLLPNKS